MIEWLSLMEMPFEAILADETMWDAQFTATDDEKLAALIASVEDEIHPGEAFRTML